MAAPISIIIPTQVDADAIGPTLAALAEGLGAGLIRELILSDGDSGDGIGDVAEAAGARLIIGPGGQAAQVQRGAEAATGAWLLILAADARPLPGWPTAAARHLEKHRDSAGRFTPVAAGRLSRLRWTLLPPRDLACGLLIRRATLDRVGGFPGGPRPVARLARALGPGGLRRLPHGIAVPTART